MRRAPGAVRGGIARDSHSVLFGGEFRRRRASTVVVLLALTAAVAALLVVVRPAVAQPLLDETASRAVGQPWDGRLVRGVQLPEEGYGWFTWDPVLDRRPDRGWRRWGTERLVETLGTVLADHRAAYPGASRVGIGDLSRTRGGFFGARYGGLGHRSHQNGLDADVYYPRKDGRERRPFTPSQVHRRRAQDLVDRFVAAGAVKVYVGPSLGLRGPRDVVQPLIYHDDHLHVRLG